jgi:Ser/Thr protein kinase RdoA (MazF antagonist)
LRATLFFYHKYIHRKGAMTRRLPMKLVLASSRRAAGAVKNLSSYSTMTIAPFPFDTILNAFGINTAKPPRPFGSGHINHTFLIESEAGGRYVLQKINTAVFTQPEAIANNLRRAAQYLDEHHPSYLFISPIPTLHGNDLFVENNNYWRLTPFVPGSTSIDEATSPTQAREAARQFGLLARNLDGLDMAPFEPTIPGFHDLSWRYRQFSEALENAKPDRKASAQELVDYFLAKREVVATYENLLKNLDFPDRLMHHDTKINNVLLDADTQRGLCVCDLDTLMPGKIISDVGDMIRTFVSPVSEESTAYDQVQVREEYYQALMEGYLSEMKHVLTDTEKANLFFAGPFLVYMQGLRFLADYLNGDIYYPVKHPEHNLNRARNQMVLLQDLYAKEERLRGVISVAL